MTDITEDGKYFSGYDHTVHQAQGHDFYIDDGLWDTYRSLHPLQLLLDPAQQQDMIESYVRMYEQSGWLPSFPSAAGEQAVMIGHHAASFILDAYSKGYRDFDVERTQDGIEQERRAIEIDPKSRDAHYVLAKGLEHEGDFENAAREGELALTLPAANASDAEIHFLLTRLYRKLNKPDLAEAHMEKFLALKKTTQK